MMNVLLANVSIPIVLHRELYVRSLKFTSAILRASKHKDDKFHLYMDSMSKDQTASARTTFNIPIGFILLIFSTSKYLDYCLVGSKNGGVVQQKRYLDYSLTFQIFSHSEFHFQPFHIFFNFMSVAASFFVVLSNCVEALF